MSDDLRVRLDIAYLGTGFAGWARQPGLRTVEGHLSEGLERILRRAARGMAPVTLTVAGRTDAGVHARGQVAHVDIDADAWSRLPGRSARSEQDALVERLSGVLDDDLVVTSARIAPPGFDARFSALSRTYRYRIADAAALRDPLRAPWTLWRGRPLDVGAMDEATAALIGLRDFAAFCRPREGATTIRELQSFSWTRPTEGPDAGLVVGEITSDAFCHNMVRALVGSSLLIGEGKRPTSWLAEVLASRDRSRAGAVAGARGLTLEAVAYPPDAELAARADAIRARRLDEEVLD
ncbi:tRNA pseudouridine(38-40) synthase TruA [Rarobacter faecitabidus]|uniref:tRNA pseudouridine synthase A n=1 Tax=Rarobacter faecitabidus TaxID=13243 RepID=A0A542ZXY9_RARFA|nr:tRNA pseudouridine(38-40) synthase TruA [Rarobacter faecitabidus]TQL65066.1 tRNA pseudouridine38-40 synthase [Rarobacter faecitabidus]